MKGTAAAHVGERVRWSGVVIDVKPLVGSGFEVWIDMNGNRIQDVYLQTRDDRAKTLQKGQRITYGGEIEGVTGLMGDDVKMGNGVIE